MKKYLVIGNPIKHSLSPKLHNHWLKRNNIDAVYNKKELDNDDLKELFKKIRDKEIEGINVTVPFKNKVIDYLDQLSVASNNTQSVNTISFEKNKLVGHNTDIDGFEQAIKDIRFNLTGKKIFIIGAGGVAPSIIFSLKRMNVSQITLSNRTQSKAEKLVKLFPDLKVLKWGEIPNFDMIINATSLGLKDSDNIDLDFSKIGSGKLFYDIIYNPKETNFLKMAKSLGNLAENGKKMFIYQAAAAFKIWHGIMPKINSEVMSLID